MIEKNFFFKSKHDRKYRIQYLPTINMRDKTNSKLPKNGEKNIKAQKKKM